MNSCLSKMSYEELCQYLVACHYAGDHNQAYQAMMEIEERYPERYHDDLEDED